MKTVPALMLLLLLAGPLHSQVLINEILASNSSAFEDEMLKNPDVIELYNAGVEPVDLSACYLSDEESNPERWIIPTGTTIEGYGHLVFFADGNDAGLHTNFRLDSKGEFVSLYSPDGVLMDSVSYPLLLNDISYGRKPDGGSGWLFYASPTLDAPNLTPGSQGIAEEPVFSVIGGFYDSPLELELSLPSNAGIVKYTLDGSVPTTSSETFITPITITQTTVVRARSFRTGYLPGITSTNTFFVNEGGFTVPVISISTAPDDLWDPDLGIYVEGNGDCSCGGGYTGNYCCTDWEKEIAIEMYAVDGSQAFSQNAGLKIFGSGSRKRIPMRSLAIFARGAYGDGDFDYRIFPERDYEKCSSFILRSSAHDWCKTLFRDAFMQGLGRGVLELDYQAYQPSVVFLNGEYWGIHNMREKVNEDYLADNHDIDPGNVDILEKNAVVVEGDGVAYDQLIDFVSTHDMSADANYAQVSAVLDVDEYIDYLILQMFTSNSDWPSNNIKYWRSREAGAQWRWIIYDMDFGFGLDTEAFHDGTYDHPTLELATDPEGTTWFNPPWATLLIRKMLDNKEFRDKFIQRFAHHLNTSFDLVRTLAMIEEYKKGIEAEIPRHIEKWGGAYALGLGYVFESPGEWDDNIDVMREFAVLRPPVMWQHLKDKFGLDETISLEIRNAETRGGSVMVDGNMVSDSMYSGTYFKGIPLTLHPLVKDGYAFSGWRVSGLTTTSGTSISTEGVEEAWLTDPELRLDMLEDRQVEAVFERTSVDYPLYINEFCAKNGSGHTDEFGRYGDWIEIHNGGEEYIDLGGFYLTDDLASKSMYRIPEGQPGITSIAPGGYLVLWADGDTLLGPLHLNFKLDRDGEDIGLSADGLCFIDSVSYPLQSVDVSYGRCPDGEGSFLYLDHQSPGAANCGAGAIPASFAQETIHVYPNPASSEIFIEVRSDQPTAGLSILDLSGRVVYSERIVPGGAAALRINLEQLSEGIYFVVLKTEHSTLTEKIVHL